MTQNNNTREEELKKKRKECECNKSQYICFGCAILEAELKGIQLGRQLEREAEIKAFKDFEVDRLQKENQELKKEIERLRSIYDTNLDAIEMENDNLKREIAYLKRQTK